jgi:5'-3' exonuclease
MGIKGFHSWLKQAYPDCVKSRTHKKYDHIYIDLNFMLHHAMFRSTKEKDFIVNLYRLLDNVLLNNFVLQSITIAIDGPSPYSKINLQRKRRATMVYDDLDIHKLNSLHLTPGTKFMINLTKHVKSYISTRKKWFRYRNVKFNFSPTTLPDEGELKVFNKLIQNGKNNIDSSHLVVGNDADLVVMAMALHDIYDIDILIKNRKVYDTVQIKRLLEIFAEKCSIPTNSILYKQSLRQDFAVISILMGNDYLPKLSFIKYDTIWDSYINTKKLTHEFLTKDSNLNMKFFKNMLENIVLTLPKQFKTINLNAYVQYGEQHIQNYLEGLVWCLQMYEYGKCYMYNYVCTSPGQPSPVFLLYYLSKNDIVIKSPISNVKPLKVYTCAILLLPRKAHKLLPEKYHSLINIKLNKYYEMEECKVCKDYRNKIKKLNDTIHCLRDLNKETDIYSCQSKKCKKEYDIHKESHKNDFTIDKIRTIVDNYEKTIKK